MNTRMNTPQEPVTAKVTAMLTRGNLIFEQWFRACDEARRRGQPEPDMPVVSEDDFREIIAQRVTWYSS
jgi:hypothetical protein